MKERSFDEMIAYFNRRVSEMDIAQDYKMELLGMVTALGYKHEKTAQQWIPCSERLPKESGLYLVTGGLSGTEVCSRYYNVRDDGGFWSGHPYDAVIAWMPLPEQWMTTCIGNYSKSSTPTT